MIKLRTSLVVWDEKREALPEGVEPPQFTIEARTKGELIEKLLYDLELRWAIMQNDGVDGIDYHLLARKARQKQKGRHRNG